MEHLDCLLKILELLVVDLVGASLPIAGEIVQLVYWQGMALVALGHFLVVTRGQILYASWLGLETLMDPKAYLEGIEDTNACFEDVLDELVGQTQVASHRYEEAMAVQAV